MPGEDILFFGVCVDVPSFEYFPLDFQVSARARWEHRVNEAFDEAVRESDAPKIFASRLIAEQLRKVYAGQGGLKPVYSSEIVAMGLLAEILRYIFDRYCLLEQPEVMARGLKTLEEDLGKSRVEQALAAFVDYFPPEEVARNRATSEQFRSKSFGKHKSEEVVAKETALLYLALENNALDAYRPLFDDTELQHAGQTAALAEGLEEFFSSQPETTILQQKLFDVLRAPMKESPYHLEGQLQYIMDHWSEILPDRLRRRLLTAAGMVREETVQRGQVFAASPTALSFRALREEAYPEPERYSEDADWMSNLVLIAKNVYVWLDQLSKKYQRKIDRLDLIPDEELERLSRWGFTGLWLIGLWKRSPASKKIKQIMGNPEAVSSAYSLYDYVISEDLGGEEALHNLSGRAGRYAIRLASDMVPNHVGLFSKWVVEHPDWFIQLDRPPFPNYCFSGPDLSEDSRISLFIEDGYWDHSDAGVVFKRVDNRTGATSYLYHGNDGTHMPWNDTAQLNYLHQEVREAAIQTILHVASRFPIIRFDAAMTLAKKHYQRLWFPKPGEGGAIPSRAEHGLPREEFDEKIPREFWSDVVDRASAEEPNTLLLAEAFWLMEGYFVRTLGMHRVYNSAFMNMLKIEDNANYRTTIKNVLEFSPEILKRFVNFMNNPDERTAVDQFGKGDKYFGVAMMLATMPGLPMLGHGQIEGFAEKYGMEYRRAYWDESVDDELVRRHEVEIFPFLKRRKLFSGSENFSLFDFFTPDGRVDENVFAYSNRNGGEKALIVYNNAYNSTRGWIKTSTAINVGCGEEVYFIQRSLSEALQLRADPGYFYIFRDHRAGKEYLRRGAEIAEKGLYFELRGYQYFALLHWQEIFDIDGSFAELDKQLEGKSVSDIVKARDEMVLQPLLAAFRGLFVKGVSDALLRQKTFEQSLRPPLENLLNKMRGYGLPAADIWDEVKLDFEIFSREEENKNLLIIWMLVKRLTPFFTAGKYHEGPLSEWMDDWLLFPILIEAFEEDEMAVLVQAMIDYSGLFKMDQVAMNKELEKLFSRHRLSKYLEVNWHGDVLWFSKEKWEKLLNCLFLGWIAETGKKSRQPSDFEFYRNLIARAKASGYRVKEFLFI